ncbi:MAG: winged helix-turn-helix domain-containing protein [Candidatus ainarchaeum sp.]|nr:winged helix-turn-helix domain-containing protein [Candidatus ainarchaeum sp.]
MALADFEKIFADFTLSKQDRETLNSIMASSSGRERPSVFYSLTHLKHNYITFTHLFNLARFSQAGCNIVIALWDMNILSSPYFKKIEFEKYGNQTTDEYIKQKKDEILRLAASLGIENVKVYTSSEIWARFTQQREPHLFTKYYSVLSTIDLDDSELNDKLSYLLQLPADIFFANFFHVLYPEDFRKPIEIAYSAPRRKNLYFVTRKAMYNSGLISMESPVIVVSKEIPRIEIDTQIPHWDMSLGEISSIVSKWQFSHEEMQDLYRNVIGNVLKEVEFVSAAGTKKMRPEKFAELVPSLSREDLVASASKNIFSFFQGAKELTKIVEAPKPDFVNVRTKKEALQLGAVLKSNNAMRILVLANGTRTISQIAKEINMQLSNTSQYIARLRKLGLVAVRDKKVFRSARGIKINFESSLKP